jgi:hypothetical protein
LPKTKLLEPVRDLLHAAPPIVRLADREAILHVV